MADITKNVWLWLTQGPGFIFCKYLCLAYFRVQLQSLIDFPHNSKMAVAALGFSFLYHTICHTEGDKASVCHSDWTSLRYRLISEPITVARGCCKFISPQLKLEVQSDYLELYGSPNRNSELLEIGKEKMMLHKHVHYKHFKIKYLLT